MLHYYAPQDGLTSSILQLSESLLLASSSSQQEAVMQQVRPGLEVKGLLNQSSHACLLTSAIQAAAIYRPSTAERA